MDKSPLQRLPAELRFYIYELVLTQADAVQLVANFDTQDQGLEINLILETKSFPQQSYRVRISASTFEKASFGNSHGTRH